MTYGIQQNHADVGETFIFEREGKPSITGVCDRVEIQLAIYSNVKTGKQTANEKIRHRLRPTTGRATWTDWMPLYPKEVEVT